jgi:hypothetical protein
MGKIAKLARPPVKASVPASASITAAEVRDFRNPEDVQASNALVGSNISDTLDNCGCVLAFLSDFHARKPGSEFGDEAADGLCLVVDWVLDAVQKQASELVVHHG